MSGSQFLEVLERIGYPKTRVMDAQSFDWIFDNESLLPFLDWFCEEITESNVLDQEELERYCELELSAEGVLDGAELQKAMQMVAVFNQDQLSGSKLETEITRLEEEIELCTLKKSGLLQQRNKLSMHQRALTDRLAHMHTAVDAAQSDYKTCQQQCQTDNCEMSSSLASLAAAVGASVDVYEEQLSDVDDHMGAAPGTPFLSSLSLDRYHTAEERFTQQLTSFTRKQFFDGIAEMVSEGDQSDYSFLDVSRPETLLTGERASVISDDCRELTRIQAHYPKSELQRIGAVVSDSGCEAACEFTENFLRGMSMTDYPRDMSQLSERLKEARSLLAIVRVDLLSLTEDEMPTLLKDSASLQVTRVLRGDYQRKVIRQQYFTAKQDQVIDQLTEQRARTEMLTMAFEMELRGHRDLHQLLTATVLQLQECGRTAERNRKLTRDPALLTLRDDRETIDSRDKFISQVYNLLDSEEDDQLFLTYSKLADNASRLRHRVSTLSGSLASAQLAQRARLADLEQQLGACEAHLYAADGGTAGRVPLLSAPTIRDSITQLDGVLRRLEEAVVGSMKDVERKRKTLRMDALQVAERDLFVYFHTDPGKLRQALAAVSSRLQAHSVH